MLKFNNIKTHAWIVFALSCALVICSLPGQPVGLCALIEPILRTTGLSRNTFSTVYMFSTILGCLGVLISGKLTDKFGIGRTLMVALPMWIFTLFLLGNCFRIYSMQSTLPKDTFCVIFFLIIMPFLRSLGQNILPLLGRMQIIRIFSNSPGLAIAICGIFGSLSHGILPLAMRSLSTNDNWEHALMVFALAGLILYAAIIFYFPKNVETAIAVRDKKTQSNCIQLKFSSIKNLIKTPAFLCIMSALCLNSFIGGTEIHIVDILREKGVHEKTALGSYIPLSMATMAAIILLGRLLDTGKIKFVILLTLSLQFLGLLGLNFAQYKIFMTVYMLAIGATWGGYAVLRTASWPKIFDQKHMGEILGLVYFMSTFTGAISIPVISMFKHVFGTYSILIHIIQVIVICCAFFCMLKFPTIKSKTKAC